MCDCCRWWSHLWTRWMWVGLLLLGPSFPGSRSISIPGSLVLPGRRLCRSPLPLWVSPLESIVRCSHRAISYKCSPGPGWSPSLGGLWWQIRMRGILWGGWWLGRWCFEMPIWFVGWGSCSGSCSGCIWGRWRGAVLLPDLCPGPGPSIGLVVGLYFGSLCSGLVRLLPEILSLWFHQQCWRFCYRWHSVDGAAEHCFRKVSPVAFCQGESSTLQWFSDQSPHRLSLGGRHVSLLWHPLCICLAGRGWWDIWDWLGYGDLWLVWLG